MRTRFLSKCTNDEVEAYLDRNDIVIVPVGVTEVHGGLPLDVETVLPEAVALGIAERVDGLVLHNLPYFFAGATQTARGTVQVSVRTAIDYLMEIAESLLRQGFRRQIWTSLHGPSNIYIAPVIRDFFEKHKVPILYIDGIQAIFYRDPALRAEMMASEGDADPFTDLALGAYDMLGRLADVPLTNPETEYWAERRTSSTEFAKDLFRTAYSSDSIAYYFGEITDHRPTQRISSVGERSERAARGRTILESLIEALDAPKLVSDLAKLDQFTQTVMARYPSTRKLI